MNNEYPLHRPAKISRIYFLNSNEIGVEIEIDSEQSMFISLPIEHVTPLIDRLQRAMIANLS